MAASRMLAALLCGLLVSAISLVAGDKPGSAAVSASDRAKIDGVFAQFAKPDSPGCALAVYRDGKIAYEHGYGFANLEHRVPNSPQTVFDIGSTSKQFTAFAILLLQKQGKLAIDDDVRKYIPELPDYGKTITLRHLLTHTSGLRDYTALFDLAGFAEQDLTTDKDALDIIMRQKGTNFAPGEEWDYSNSGFFLLSQVVKRVAGESIREFSQKNIFTPLGMTHTQIFDYHGLVIPNRATGYSFNGERKQFIVEMSNFEQAGDGSVQTSVEDMLRWDDNFYTGKVGGKDIVDSMRTPGKLNDGSEHGYGFGLFMAKYRGIPVISHGGAWAGYRAEVMRFPQQHTSIAVLCNQAESRPTRLAHQVADVILADVLERDQTPPEGKTAKVSSDVLQGRAGIYRNATGEYRRLDFKDGKLLLALAGGLELVPESDNSFNFAGHNNILFSPDGSMKLTFEAIGKPVEYSRVKVEQPGDLSRFVGDYYSPELDTTWTVALANGQLTVGNKRGLTPPEPLLPVSQDTFITDSISMRFVSDPAQPMKAIVSADRIRNLQFTATRLP